MKNVCPVCRKKILVNVNFYCVNVALERILFEKYGFEKNYKERMAAAKKFNSSKHWRWTEEAKKWIKERIPWIIVVLLLYHLLRVKINVFNLLFEKYKTKALNIANSIEKENSLDFKFLLFSQFIRILFSNLVIAWWYLYKLNIFNHNEMFLILHSSTKLACQKWNCIIRSFGSRSLALSVTCSSQYSKCLASSNSTIIPEFPLSHSTLCSNSAILSATWLV